MRSTLSSARPITVLLILLALDAGGAMAENSTLQYNLANQVCCDPDSGSMNSAPTIIACTDYPRGRVGRFWSGQIVCLSHRNGGYPKTAAGCASLNAGDECLPFGESDSSRKLKEGGKCEEDLSISGERCVDGDSCWTYPYLVCVGSSDAAGSISACDSHFYYSDCPDGKFCCTRDMYSTEAYCMPGALFPGDDECQDYAGLVGCIVGIVCGVACLVGGVAYFFVRSKPQAPPQVGAYGGGPPPGVYQEGGGGSYGQGPTAAAAF